MARVCILFAVLSAGPFCAAAQAAQAPLRILFFAPTSEGNTYWPGVHRVLRAAAGDLAVDLVIHEFDVGDRFAKHVEGVRILRQEPTADGAIFSVAFGNTEPLLEAAEALGIPVLIHGPLFPSELPTLGGTPRTKYRQWVGYFYQDEAGKGYRLGKALLDAAHAAGSDPVAVVGIGGDTSWFGSRLREQGLGRAVREDPAARLLQVAPTKWTQAEGASRARLLHGRYPEATVFWAASDQLALGACGALEAAGGTPGKTFFTGGLDLSRKGLEAVKDGRLVATVASLACSYVEMLVYLHDYVHGVDFADEVGTEVCAQVHAATRGNVDQYLELLDTVDEVDYRALSKASNPEREDYDFSLENLLAVRK